MSPIFEPKIPSSSTYDVIIYSGTPCGIAAAVAAARQGSHTLLIEPTRHVGGLSTSGINTAESEHMLKWTIGGFALEFYKRLGDVYGSHEPEFYFESSVAEKVYIALLEEAGVTLRLQTRIQDCRKDGTQLKELRLEDGSRLTAGVFIDASYEGDLMALAGVNYHIGRESRDTYEEALAGIRFDSKTHKIRCTNSDGELLPGISGWQKDFTPGDAHPAPMNYNFRLTVTQDPDRMIPIPDADEYAPERYALLANWIDVQTRTGQAIELRSIVDLYARRNGKFELNNTQKAIFSLGHFGGQFAWSDASPATRAMIYKDHLNYTLGLLQFLRTSPKVPLNIRREAASYGLHTDEFIENQHLPYQLYVREARRMQGAYIVTQKDIQEHRRKPDSIGISSHFIDCHHVQRLAVSENEFVNEGRIWQRSFAYQIPYRALTPKTKQCSNLLVPCAASFSHVAFCSYRVESVWMIAGYATGHAAAMAAQRAVPVQAIDIQALQDALRAEGQVVDFIPGAPEFQETLNGPDEG